MGKHKFKIIISIVVMLLLYVGYTNFYHYNNKTVSIKEHIFSVEVVDTPVAMQIGLSAWKSIDDNQAMLFVFPDKAQRTFWMKDMNFNIDLLWIDGEQIVAYEKNMLAPDEDVALDDLLRYSSVKEVDKVLEFKAGLIDTLDIQIGDTININI